MRSTSVPWTEFALGAHAQAVQTERGMGAPPFGGLNLGDHVGDDPEQVLANRARLVEVFGASPVFVRQVHGHQVARVDSHGPDTPAADALVTRDMGLPIGVLTADCLPILFAGPDRVGAAHAGWRGLLSGVIEATLRALTGPDELEVWLGPCIGPAAFEVGPEVIERFLARCADWSHWIGPAPTPGHGYLDLQGIASDVLRQSGVSNIRVCRQCTRSDADRWYSYRRDGQTGRMASCIMRSG